MKMKKYLIGFRIEGSLRSHLPKTRFTIDNVKCELLFPRGEHQGRIQAQLKISATTNKEAEELARPILDNVIDVISLITDSSLYLEEVYLILRNDKGSQERIVFRSIAQTRYNGRFITNKTAVDIQHTLDKELDRKVKTALRWLRLGHRSRSYHEQFIYYWLAIERIVGEITITRSCENCGHPHNYPGIDKAKIKELIEQSTQINDRDFGKLWELRKEVFHGRSPISRFLHEKTMNAIQQYLFPSLTKILKDQLNVSGGALQVSRPIYFMKKDNRFQYLKFQTLHPQDEYARDFPTDEQIEQFTETHDVVSKDGFEIVNWDTVYNTW